MKVKEDAIYVAEDGRKVLVVTATPDNVNYMELRTRRYLSMTEDEFLENFELCK